MNKPKRFFRSIKPQAIALAPKAFKLPTISRIFPERFIESILLNPVFVTAFVSGFIVMAIGIVGNDLRNSFIRLGEVNKERLVVEGQIAKWKRVLGKYRNYKDGYFMISVLEYSLGNYQQSYEYVAKALAIDPNYKDAKKLLVKLQENK